MPHDPQHPSHLPGAGGDTMMPPWLTLPEVIATLPAPDGAVWEYHPNIYVLEFPCGGKVRIKWSTPARWDIKAWRLHHDPSASHGGEEFEISVMKPEGLLPAYRRALVAVGLASPWTREVPTEPGVYVVRSNSRQTGGEMFRLYDEDEHGDAGERPWVDANGRHRTISQMSGCLFLPLPLSDVPCPQPPKET